MACIKPPALTDEQLLAFIDEAATDNVVAHVQQCADCRKRANALAHQQKQLAAQLYRVDCPSSLELGEYYIGMVAPERMLFVEQHLAICLHCAREVQTLQKYLKDLAPTLEPIPHRTETGPALRQRIKVLIAKLIEPGFGAGVSGGLMPASASLRGDQEEQFVYKADDIQIVIEIQASATEPARKMLLGLVLGLDAAQTVNAYLEQVGAAPIISPIDELGNFVFDHLIPGTYTLCLRSAESEILVEALMV